MFCQEVADIFRKFDLGQNLLIPLQVYQYDRKAKIGHPYFMINRHHYKTSFVPAESRDILLPTGRKPETTDYWDMPWYMKDGDIAVNASALEGPDLWQDKMLSDALFMKGKVVAALREGGWTRQFKPKKCRVI